MWFLIIACGDIEQSNEISSTNISFSDGYDSESELLYEEILTEFDIEMHRENSESDQPEYSSECDHMYMLHQQEDGTSELWNYNINTTLLTSNGTIECFSPGALESFLSMSGDDKGNLWLLTDLGNIFRLHPETMDCQNIGINPTEFDPFFAAFGITLVTKAQSNNHTFYLSGLSLDISGLKKVIIKQTAEESSHVASIGPYDLESDHLSYIPDIAGSRSDLILGLQATSPTESKIIEVEPQTGEFYSLWEGSLEIGMVSSLIHHQDKYWIFAGTEEDTTELHVFDTASQTTVMEEIFNLSIVGASLSSCLNEESAY